MKRIFLVYLLCLSALAGWTQTSKSELLTRKVWKIQADEMSGVGAHTSLPKETELHFFVDGTWKSSHPFRNASDGKWRLENNDRTLVLSISNEETRYSILQLADKELNLRLKKNAATYNYKWVTKE